MWCVCVWNGCTSVRQLEGVPEQFPHKPKQPAGRLQESRAGSLLGVCRGRPQDPDGHQVRVHRGSTAQVALGAALQPASARAPLAKVFASSPLWAWAGGWSRASCLPLLELLHGSRALSCLGNQGCTS